jgi:hypothetical protein
MGKFKLSLVIMFRSIPALDVNAEACVIVQSTPRICGVHCFNFNLLYQHKYQNFNHLVK